MTKRRAELRRIAIGRSKTLRTTATWVARVLGSEANLTLLLRGTAALLDLLVKELDKEG